MGDAGGGASRCGTTGRACRGNLEIRNELHRIDVIRCPLLSRRDQMPSLVALTCPCPITYTLR